MGVTVGGRIGCALLFLVEGGEDVDDAILILALLVLVLAFFAIQHNKRRLFAAGNSVWVGDKAFLLVFSLSMWRAAMMLVAVVGAIFLGRHFSVWRAFTPACGDASDEECMYFESARRVNYPCRAATQTPSNLQQHHQAQQ